MQTLAEQYDVPVKALRDQYYSTLPLIQARGNNRDLGDSAKGPTDTMRHILPHCIENERDYLVLVVSALLILPLTTAPVERGFSKLNLIKTQLRSRIGPKCLNAAMVVSIEGPSLQDFNFEKALKTFKKAKNRRLI